MTLLTLVEFARRQPAFHAQYMASPAMIRMLDEQLARMAVPGERDESARALRDALPSSGHPTRFFMANLIAEALGIHPLIEEVGNPFAFLRLYHAAALMTRGMGEIEAPPLSDAALRVVEGVELKYVTGSGVQPSGGQLGSPWVVGVNDGPGYSESRHGAPSHAPPGAQQGQAPFRSDDIKDCPAALDHTVRALDQVADHRELPAVLATLRATRPAAPDGR